MYKFPPSQSRQYSALICSCAILVSTILVNPPQGLNPVVAQTPTPVPSSGTTLPNPVAQKLIQQVARETGISPTKLKIAAAKSATFNGCMGIYRPHQACTLIALSGWQTIITSPKTTFVYHLDRNATRIVQNSTASGAGQAINVSFDLFGGEIPPVGPQVMFQSMLSGDLTGRTTTITLTEDGKITEFTVAPYIRSRPVVRKTLTPQQLARFKQLLETQRFPNLHQLSYLTSAALADYPTTTYQSRTTVTQFIDLEKKNLPASLQRVITAWDSLIR